MPWTYEQSSGRMFRPDGTLAATGYAGGNCGRNPEGVNNPDLQNMHAIGPLPTGAYTFLAAINSPHLGPMAIPLDPDNSNSMFGRTSFYVHGDTSANNQSASEGCIIMPRVIRGEIVMSQDRKLVVVPFLPVTTQTVTGGP